VQPSTDAEWDEYEWSSWFMRDTYLGWRRAAFGFALVAARKPEA
jgi:hypothetical protein